MNEILYVKREKVYKTNNYQQWTIKYVTISDKDPSDDTNQRQHGIGKKGEKMGRNGKKVKVAQVTNNNAQQMI